MVIHEIHVYWSIQQQIQQLGREPVSSNIDTYMYMYINTCWKHVTTLAMIINRQTTDNSRSVKQITVNVLGVRIGENLIQN